jgi:hypothetical protein
VISIWQLSGVADVRQGLLLAHVELLGHQLRDLLGGMLSVQQPEHADRDGVEHLDLRATGQDHQAAFFSHRSEGAIRMSSRKLVVTHLGLPASVRGTRCGVPGQNATDSVHLSD